MSILRFEHRQFPGRGCIIVSQKIRRMVIAPNFEVAMFRGQPPVHNLDYLDAPMAQTKTPGRLFSSVPRISLNAELQISHLSGSHGRPARYIHQRRSRWSRRLSP